MGEHFHVFVSGWRNRSAKNYSPSTVDWGYERCWLPGTSPISSGWNTTKQGGTVGQQNLTSSLMNLLDALLWLLAYLSWRDFWQLQIAPFPLPSTISYLRDSHNIGDLLMNLLTNGLVILETTPWTIKPTLNWLDLHQEQKNTQKLFGGFFGQIYAKTHLSFSLSLSHAGPSGAYLFKKTDTVSCLRGYSLSIQSVFLQAWCNRMCRWRYTCTCTGRYWWKCKLTWICVHRLHGRVLAPIVFKRYLISKGNFIF